MVIEEEVVVVVVVIIVVVVVVVKGYVGFTLPARFSFLRPLRLLAMTSHLP